MLRKKSTGALLNRIARNTGLMLFFIVIFGIILRLIFFSGIGTSDDMAYTRYAYSLGQGELEQDTLTLSTRLGLVYPVSFLYSIFGVNDFSSVLFVIITAIGNIILIFYFGKLLFNEKIGLVSAFLLSFFPLEVVYSTKLFTDLPSAFFMALGVYIFLYSEKKKAGSYLYLLSGISIGIGYLIRESALLIALFFVFYILYMKRLKKEYFLVPIGILAIFSLEAIIFLQLTGNPFFRWEASQEYLTEAMKVHNYFGRLEFPSGLFHYPYIILTSGLLSFFYIMISVAALYCIFYRKKESYEMLLWLVPLLLYLSFGSAGLAKYIPFRAVDRYLEIVTIPGILLLGYFICGSRNVKKYSTAILIFLLISSSGVVYFNGGRHVLKGLKDAYGDIQSLETPIYIDERSLRALNYIGGYKEINKAQEYPQNFAGAGGSYTIINKNMIEKLKEADKNTKFPEEIENIPKRWVLHKEIGKGENSILIYRIP